MRGKNLCIFYRLVAYCVSVGDWHQCREPFCIQKRAKEHKMDMPIGSQDQNDTLSATNFHRRSPAFRCHSHEARIVGLVNLIFGKPVLCRCWHAKSDRLFHRSSIHSKKYGAWSFSYIPDFKNIDVYARFFQC